MEQLPDDQVRTLIVDLGAEEHDPVGEQPGVEIEAALTA